MSSDDADRDSRVGSTCDDSDDELGSNEREQACLTKVDPVQVNKIHKGREHAYKNQGGVQIPDILGNQVVVVFISDFLVDGLKVCSWVILELRRFQTCNGLLKPKVEHSWFGSSRTHIKLGGILTE